MKSIKFKSIDDHKVTSITGSHWSGYSNRDVVGFKRSFGSRDFIPKGLTNFFPNLKDIEIFDANMKEISKDDLKEFGSNLEKLWLWYMKITHISHDLFEYNPYLKEIVLWANEIQTIEYGAFDNLFNLVTLDLDENICISEYVYNDYYGLRNFIQRVYERCSVSTAEASSLKISGTVKRQ